MVVVSKFDRIEVVEMMSHKMGRKIRMQRKRNWNQQETSGRRKRAKKREIIEGRLAMHTGERISAVPKNIQMHK
jgi:hypothetical protein